LSPAHTGGPPIDWREVDNPTHERWEYGYRAEHSSYFVRGLLIDKKTDRAVKRISKTYFN